MPALGPEFTFQRHEPSPRSLLWTHRFRGRKHLSEEDDFRQFTNRVGACSRQTQDTKCRVSVLSGHTGTSANSRKSLCKLASVGSWKRSRTRRASKMWAGYANKRNCFCLAIFQLRPSSTTECTVHFHPWPRATRGLTRARCSFQRLSWPFWDSSALRIFPGGVWELNQCCKISDASGVWGALRASACLGFTGLGCRGLASNKTVRV